MGLATLWACQAPAPDQPASPAETPQAILPPTQPCGQSLLIELFNETGLSVGSLTCENDSSHLWLEFDPAKGRTCMRSPIRYNVAGATTWQEFPALALQEGGTYAASIDITDWPAGTCISLEGELLLQDAAGTVLKGRISSPGRPNRIDYCLQSCVRFSDLCAGLDLRQAFRAYPAEVWLQGGGPARHPLDAARFTRAFPEGLPVGCASPQHLKDLAATQAWAKAATTPEERLLAQEFVGLSLNLALDRAEPDFGPGPDRLDELVLAEGDFAGWTTLAVLEELRAALGDCPSNYAFRQLSAAAAGINNDFYPEGQHHGFLGCPAD